MDILVFSSYYPFKGDSNPEQITNAVHYFCKEWVKNGNRVIVINLEIKFLNMNNWKNIISKDNIFESIEGVKIYKFQISRIIPKKNKIFNIQIKGVVKDILDILDNEDFSPDHIVCHFPLTQWDIIKKVIFKINVPTTFTLHNSDISYIERNNFLEFKHFVMKNNVNVLFRSKNIGKKYYKFFNTNILNLNDKIVYSGSPILIKEWDYVKKFKKNSFNIIFVGNLVKQKNVDIILQALRELKEKKSLNFSFKIVGVGSEKENLKKLAQKLNLIENVKFLGRMSREEVLDEMRLSDIFVMVSSPETFGLVYIEAMATGCITIGSEGEGIDGVIKSGENGFLVRPNSVDHLVEKLNYIREMTEEEKNKIIENAVNTGEKYTESSVAIDYLERIVNFSDIK